MRRKVTEPTRRSSRVSATKEVEKTSYVSSDKKWNLKEKKQFLAGLKKYGIHNIEMIQKEYIPHRCMDDIKYFMTSKKRKGRRILRNIGDPGERKEDTKKTPIEVWIREGEDLTRREHDHSYALAKVFSMFSTLEPHDKLASSSAPDYSAIYQYITALLQGKNPPTLTGSDSTILLYLIDSLADDLKRFNTSSQRNLMELKYKLLTSPAIVHDKEHNHLKIRQALEEDPLELLAPSDPMAPQTPTPSTSSSNQRPPSTPSANQETPSTPSATQEAPSTPSANQEAPSTLSANQEAPSTPSAKEEAPSSSSANQNTPTTSSANDNDIQPSTSSNQRPGSVPRGELRPKKTPLYTLNPFCVPIKYLKMKPCG